MHKILFHAGLSPLAQPSMKRVFMDNIFTNNSGNLLFQYGAYRTLMTDDAEITATFFDRQANQSPQSVERFNSEYACAVMPMANNFRGSYNLKPMTRFIRQLKIPCIVMGIGLQASDPALIAQGFPFDDDVRDFVKAILDHSAILGLRGEMTADYLQKLGFTPERHFTVIGCPSMYSRGLNLPKARPLSLGPDSSVSFGYRIDQPAEMAELLNRGMAEFKNYHIVAQRREEIFMLRYGRPLVYTYDKANRCASLYPHDATHPAVREGRMVGFTSAHAWLKFMEGMDFNMGSRIHGNIAAVLSGTPTLALTLDTRMEELCRYHNIPHIPASQIDPAADPRTLCEGVDFNQIQKGHAQRFAHFVDFMDSNGLDHIFKNGASGENAPMDRALAVLPEWGMVIPETPVPMSVRLEGLALDQHRKLRDSYHALSKARRKKKAGSRT